MIYYFKDLAYNSQFEEGKTRQVGIKLDKHTYETQDNYAYIGAGPATLEGEFYNAEEVTSGSVTSGEWTKNSYGMLYITTGKLKYTHERLLYSFLDVLADFGGVADILIGVASIFFGPFTEMSFFIDLLSNLFLVKTKDKEIVTPGTREKKFKTPVGLMGT